jgi:hypothetical protein
MNAQTLARVSQGITTPAGGYCRIPISWLYGVWWCYRRGHLEFQDVRVYCALHEMIARRCQMSTGRAPRFTVEEVQSLTGLNTSRSCRESLRRLQTSGWAEWKLSEIRFADGTMRAEDKDCWEADFGRIANRLRRVPVPRRTLRFLGRVRQPVMAATVLGHLFRCLYAKGQVMSAVGSVAASWIADIFDVDIRSAKRARAQLRAIKWLTVQASDHWHRQRYGERVAINLAWNPPTHSTTVQMPPPILPRYTQLSSPDSNKKLPNGIKNQKPASPRLSGVHKSNTRTPTLRNIQLDDLRDAGRVMILFRQAQERGLLGRSEHDRLAFVGAAVHAASKATRNPGGLFWSLVRDRLWHHVTAADERQAQSMLQRHLFGSPLPEPHRPRQRRDHQLFSDVQFVSHVTQSLQAHGYRGDPYEAVVRQAPQWTRERWNRALQCWLTPRREQAISARDS